MKEVIYTGIFLVLAVVLAVVLFLMFGRGGRADAASADVLYHAGVYTSPITLNDNTFDVEVTVDEDHINSISLVNLSETTTAMYPLMEPSDDNKYTSMLLLDAINDALDKAKVQ